MAKKKSLWQKAKELANPDATWSERKTGRDKAIEKRVDRELGRTSSKKRKNPRRYTG